MKDNYQLQQDCQAITEARDEMYLAHDKIKTMGSQISEAMDCIRRTARLMEKLPQLPLIRILSEPISTLRLSGRATKVLTNAGMTTLGHVCACSPDRLQEFQNCGAKTAKEIEQAMAECGLPLGFNVRRMRQRFSKLI